MAQGLVTKQYLQDIADAIRRKTDEAGSASALPLVAKEVTQNGTYRASDDDAFGYSHVTVDVDSQQSVLVNKTITENGTYNPSSDSADGYSQVTVNVEAGTELTSSDEGKVVVEDDGSYVLAEQTSLNVSENGTYDTTTNDEVVVSVSGGGGASIYDEIPEEKYVLGFTPSSNARQAKSGGFEFYSSKRIVVSKIRVFPRTTSVNVYISRDSTTVASVLDAQVTAEQWNDVTLDSPITLDDGVFYNVWYSHGDGTALKYMGGGKSSAIAYITNNGSKYSETKDNIPTNNDSSATYGVDLYVDAYMELSLAVLTPKTITQNGTYDPSDDNADGYSQVTVNVEGGSDNITDVPVNNYILPSFEPNRNASSAKSGGFLLTVTGFTLVASKVNVFARTSAVDIYIYKDTSPLVSILNETVVANQWNEVSFDTPLLLYAGTYTVFYSHTDGTTCKYVSSSRQSQISFAVTSAVWGGASGVLPTNPESGVTYGINLYIDSYKAAVISDTVLVPKTIVANGVYDPADDEADGYSSVTVSVLDTPANDLLFHFDDDMYSSGTIDVGISDTTGYELSSEQAKFGTHSLKVSGASNSGAVLLGNDFAFGTDDFTIDFWMYPTYGGGNGSCVFSFSYRSIGYYRKSTTERGLTLASSSSSWAVDHGGQSEGSNIDNSWHHIAITRSSGVVRVFVDGTKEDEFEFSSAIAPTTKLSFGTNSSNNNVWRGYIDEFRVRVGNAVWTEDFTPPTRPYGSESSYLIDKVITANGTYDPADDQVDGYSEVRVAVPTGLVSDNDLLFHFDNDMKNSGKAGAVMFDATGYELSDEQVKFGTHSLKVVGAPSLSGAVALDDGFALGSNDFTIDFWMYCTSSDASQCPVSFNYRSLGFYVRGTNFGIAVSISGSSWYIDNTTTVTNMNNAWHHIALCRYGSRLYYFLDGVKIDDFDIGNNSIYNLRWLSFGTNSSSTTSWRGYIDEFRMKVGEAVWTEDFTPPTEQYDGSSGRGTSDNDLLFHFDSDMLNYGTADATISDDYEKYVLSDEQSKFGSKSLKIVGKNTSSGRVGPAHIALGKEFSFGSDDFTIDFWEYSTFSQAAPVVFSYRSVGLWVRGTSAEIAITSDSSSWDYDVTKSIPDMNNSWHHVALCRNGQTIYAFLDGSVIQTGNIGDIVIAPTNVLILGYGSWTGYISELRVKLGEAVWTEDFTPPTEPYV